LQRAGREGFSSFGWCKKTPTEACYFLMNTCQGGTPAKAENLQGRSLVSNSLIKAARLFIFFFW